MGKAVEAKASLMHKCATFLMSKLRNAAPDVRAEAGPVVAEAYWKGGSDSLTEVLDSCKDARARNPECASCPALQEVEGVAQGLLAQCHGAAADQTKN